MAAKATTNKTAKEVVWEDNDRRSRTEKLRWGQIVATAVVGILASLILHIAYGTSDKIDTLKTDVAVGKSERTALMEKAKSDKDILVDKIDHLSTAVAEYKRTSDEAIRELRASNQITSDKVTALATKVDMLFDQRAKH